MVFSDVMLPSTYLIMLITVLLFMIAYFFIETTQVTFAFHYKSIK